MKNPKWPSSACIRLLQHCSSTLVGQPLSSVSCAFLKMILWFFFKMDFMFRAVLGSAKLNGRCRDFPYTSDPIHKELPPLSTSPTSGTFVMVDEPIPTCQYHPKSFRLLGFSLSVVHSMSLYKHIRTYIHHHSIIQCIFMVIFCTLPIHPYSCPWKPLIFFIVSKASCFLECHIVVVMLYVAFSY